MKNTNKTSGPKNYGGGWVMSQREYYRELKRNGYTVEFTPEGVLIYR